MTISACNTGLSGNGHKINLQIPWGVGGLHAIQSCQVALLCLLMVTHKLLNLRIPGVWLDGSVTLVFVRQWLQNEFANPSCVAGDLMTMLACLLTMVLV